MGSKIIQQAQTQESIFARSEHKILQESYTFDDVLLVPGHSEVLPKEVCLKSELTPQLKLNIPLCASAMDTVSESAMAIAMAQEGGFAVIHKNMSIEEQAREVSKVKRHENGVVKDPITADPDMSVKAVIELTDNHGFSGVPIVEGQDLVGIVTSRDIRFETRLDQPVSAIMTPKERLITADEKATREDIIGLLHRHRIEKILMVNDQFHLKGLVTVRDIQQAKDKPLACKDARGQLIAAAATGTSAETFDRVAALVEAGLDILVVDTAHGHSAKVLHTIESIRSLYPHLTLIGGNIATAQAALALKSVGVNAVKVGIGPGSICTTRIVSGVGVPQVSAIMNVAAALQDSTVSVIADGGIRYSGDVAKAIAAGADMVMVGSLLAGCDESPGEIELFQGRSYKTYRGMGSIAAMKQGSSDRYFQGEASQEKLVPEGIEGRVPYKGPVTGVLHQLTGGLRSGMGYCGCDSIVTMQDNAQFVKVTAAGMHESHVHDVTMTREPPNYQGRR